MSLSNNSVCSSVFTYNPYVLTRPYQHLTIMDMIGLHLITWVSHNIQSISVSIVGFGDCACTCKMDIPMSCHKQIATLQQKFIGITNTTLTLNQCLNSLLCLQVHFW